MKAELLLSAYDQKVRVAILSQLEPNELVEISGRSIAAKRKMIEYISGNETLCSQVTLTIQSNGFI
jgi:hypothetical protein